MDSYTKNGYTVTFEHDSDAWSPDEWENTDAFVIAGHRDFTIRREGFPLDGKKNEKFKYFPLYAYIHGGVALSLGREGQFSCQWDSCQVGWVVVKKDPSCRAKGVGEYRVAESVVKEWNYWLSGDVWYVSITDSRGDEVESTGGIVSREGAEEYAEGVLSSCGTCEEWTEVKAIEALRACLKNLVDRDLIKDRDNDHYDEIAWCLEKTQYWVKKEVSNG